MIPLLFRIGPVPVHSFGLTIALALIVGAVRLGRSFSHYGLEPRLAERYVMWGGLSGIIGARLWFIFENWPEVSGDLFGALVANAGFTFYGGFIVAALVIVARARRDKVSVPVLADALGPTLALGYAIGRLGCQLSGDGDYGVPNSGFWSMAYEDGTVPTPYGVRVYPTPLFESAWCLVIAWFLGRLELNPGRFSPTGARFSLYLCLIATERFFVEFLRPTTRIWGPLSQAQCVSVGLILIAVVICLGTIRPAERPASKA